MQSLKPAINNKIHNTIILIILETGASTGIGNEMAKMFAKEKCSLALLARRGELLDELKSQLQTSKANINVYKCDVADSDEVKKVFTKVREHFNKFDIEITADYINSFGYTPVPNGLD